jgi:hydroxycarboxylate dehydrogenase B
MALVCWSLLMVAASGDFRPIHSAGGAPMPDGPPLLMDMSTSKIAEGKIKVARSRGDSLPPGLIVNGRGEPSTSPEEYYSEPPGALLPMAEHKGFALSMFCEVLAGAMTGAGCSKQGVERVANGFMAFLLDPDAFAGREFVSSELGHLAEWVKSSRLQTGTDKIQLPGEPEANAKKRRCAAGIDIDDTTWQKIGEIASTSGVVIPTLSPSSN